MTIRARYTPHMKARHLKSLARMTWDSTRPALELATHTARIILTRHYIDTQDPR